MSKLYERAKVKLENAKNSYVKIQLNDAYMDDCCFNLEQTIEMMLKYCVEMAGETYVENHDIRAQINRLGNLQNEIPDLEKLRLMAPVINEWEGKSRCSESFTATLQDIQEVMELAEALNNYCSGLVKDSSF